MVHVGHFGLHHMFHLHYVNGHPVVAYDVIVYYLDKLTPQPASLS